MGCSLNADRYTLSNNSNIKFRLTLNFKIQEMQTDCKHVLCVMLKKTYKENLILENY